MSNHQSVDWRLESLSARRAWIEITTDEVLTNEEQVALRKESVDRNALAVLAGPSGPVALRKESVDRNSSMALLKRVKCVALRKESVDRNSSLMKFSWNLTRRSPQGERG